MILSRVNIREGNSIFFTFREQPGQANLEKKRSNSKFFLVKMIAAGIDT